MKFWNKNKERIVSLIKAVIFDLDGTLLNTLGDLQGAVNAALTMRKLPARTMEEVRQFIGNGVRMLMYRAMPEGSSEDEIDAALADFRAYYAAHIRDNTQPYAGIPELIETCAQHGIKMAVLSNKMDSATKELISHFFPGKMEVIFGQRSGIPCKPDPTSCQMVIDQLDIAKEYIVYVGDSGVDMQTAANAGLTSVGVTWGFRNREDLVNNGAAYLADTPEQLWQLMRDKA